MDESHDSNNNNGTTKTNIESKNNNERQSSIIQEKTARKVYVIEGRIGAELRANTDVAPGELILTESAYCFGRHDDDDDDTASLPSIVQAALEALQKDGENNKAVIDSPSGKSRAKSRINSEMTRKWKDLMATEDQPNTMEDDSEDPQRQQKEALFDWGAQQIMQRLIAASSLQNSCVTKQDAVEAIQRVSLNAFSVKPSMNIINNNSDSSCWTAHTITSDEDLQQAIMSIGTNTTGSTQESETMGDAVFLLASAANHSCRPNAHVTFHCPQQVPVAAAASNNNTATLASEEITISIRAIASIQKDEAVTISYGPLVGVNGSVRDRRAAIRASGTQSFECRCSACLKEEKEIDDSSGIDAAAMLFIETHITGGQTTAEEALVASQKFFHDSAPASSRHFGKAMSDTSLQIIPHHVQMAVEFQKLALQSLELRCHPSIAGVSATTINVLPKEDDPLAMAFELIKLSLLQLFNEEEEGERASNNTNCNDKDKMIQRDVIRARRILCRYYGEDSYPYRQLLNSILC